MSKSACLSYRAQLLLDRISNPRNWYPTHSPSTPKAMQELIDAGLVRVGTRMPIAKSYYVPTSYRMSYVERYHLGGGRSYEGRNMTEACEDHWYLGAMNDGLFIINRPPRPSTDYMMHDRPDGPSLVLNITDLPAAKATAVVDAHNATLNAIRDRGERDERRRTYRIIHEWFGKIEHIIMDDTIGRTIVATDVSRPDESGKTG